MANPSLKTVADGQPPNQLEGKVPKDTARPPTWRNNFTLSSLVYFGTPLAYTAFIVSMVRFGSEWFLKTVETVGAWSPLVWATPDPNGLSGRAMFIFALISMAVAAMRIYGATKIPLTATLGTTIDRIISFCPSVVLFGFVVWAVARGWPVDSMQIRFVGFAFITQIVFDVFLSSVVVNVIRESRRTIL